MSSSSARPPAPSTRSGAPTPDSPATTRSLRSRWRHVAPVHRRRTKRSLVGRSVPAVTGVLAVLAACAVGSTAPSEDALVPTAGTATRAATTSYSIWPETVVPRNPADRDSSSVAVGVNFSTSKAGVVTGIQFYRGAGNKGPHRGKLWNAQGQVVGRVDFPTTPTTGWVTGTLATPVRITPGARYVASYVAPSGHYAGDVNTLGDGMTKTTGDLTAWKGVYSYGTSMPTATWQKANYYVDPVFLPDVVTDAPAPPPPPPTTPTPPPPTPSTGFPTADNTGVPSGTSLSAYTGPCTITAAGTVIDAKTVNCDLDIRTSGVIIRNSVVNGTVHNDESVAGRGFTITDSEVRVGNRPGTGIESSDFTAVRVEVTGGNRSINCWRNCTVRDSYVHGQFTDPTGVYHESGIRMGSGGTIVHNAIACDAPDVPPDAGCSASLTGYGDFAAVERMTVSGNLFMATTGGTCAYGGSSGGKPYSNAANNIVFTDNVFQHGRNGNCGYWAPVMDFNPSAPGNVWSGNTWEGGGAVSAG